MKKIYVKPEASSVAFAVNENIAVSGDILTSLNGTITYVQTGDNCNKIINSTNISTGLKDGCTNVAHVMAHLAAQKDSVYGTDLKELEAILQKLQDEGKEFNCAGADIPA